MAFPKPTPEQYDTLLSFLPQFESADEARVKEQSFQEDIKRFLALLCTECWYPDNEMRTPSDPYILGMLKDELRIRLAPFDDVKAMLQTSSDCDLICDGFFEAKLVQGNIGHVLSRLKDLRGEVLGCQRSQNGDGWDWTPKVEECPDRPPVTFLATRPSQSETELVLEKGEIPPPPKPGSTRVPYTSGLTPPSQTEKDWVLENGPLSKEQVFALPHELKHDYLYGMASMVQQAGQASFLEIKDSLLRSWVASLDGVDPEEVQSIMDELRSAPDSD
jgi:hypothetical protein